MMDDALLEERMLLLCRSTLPGMAWTRVAPLRVFGHLPVPAEDGKFHVPCYIVAAYPFRWNFMGDGDYSKAVAADNAETAEAAVDALREAMLSFRAELDRALAL